MKLTLIYNPTAGYEKPDKDELIRLLTKEGYVVNFVNSDEDNLDEALQNPGALVVVAGGDGTIAKVARRLVGQEVPIGIFSVGTANNIATTFDACGSPETQISSWDLSTTAPFNVGTVKGSLGEAYFFEAVGFGLLPHLVTESKKRQKAENITFSTRQEKIKFGLKVLSSIIHKIPVEHYQIEADGEDLTGDYFLVEVMNIKSVGPHVFLAPDADPGDGLFDVVLMKEEEKELLLQFVKKQLKGEKPVLDVKKRRASKLKIKTVKSRCHVDDEVEEMEGEIVIAMDKRNLKIV